MTAVISVEGVGHTYNNGTVALDDVNLDIGTGLFGLLGPNGAGKSTLMKAICTILVPVRGRVSVGGLDVVADRRAVRGLLGYLPQHFSAWRLQTVTETLDALPSADSDEHAATHRAVPARRRHPAGGPLRGGDVAGARRSAEPTSERQSPR